jgi:hypothetical protein
VAVGVPWPPPGVGFQVIVKPPVPPEGRTEASPSQVGPQLAFCTVRAGTIGEGAVIVNDRVVSQVAASAIVSV